MNPDDRDQRMERLREALAAAEPMFKRDGAYDFRKHLRVARLGLAMGAPGDESAMAWAKRALAAHDQAKAAERSGG